MIKTLKLVSRRQEKFYVTILILKTGERYQLKKHHRTATQAMEYGVRVAARIGVS